MLNKNTAARNDQIMDISFWSPFVRISPSINAFYFKQNCPEIVFVYMNCMDIENDM
jgi:hypothetical protein